MTNAQDHRIINHIIISLILSLTKIPQGQITFD